MTAVAAWIRPLKQGVNELCVIADSRLGGDGRNIDGCPKILPFPRGDMALCFAGETQVAYPFFQSLFHTSTSFRAARTRGLDIIEYRPHILKILNDLVSRIDTPIEELKIPECSFIPCGYSWIQKRFRMWTIRYHPQLRRFHHDKAGSICHNKESIIFGGDAGDRLRQETGRILTERRGHVWGSDPLTFEPLEALSNLLAVKDSNSTIGGPPQFVKLYQHINSLIVPIYWPRGQREKVAYLGRPLLGYERIDDWVFDVETLTTHPFSMSTGEPVTE